MVFIAELIGSSCAHSKALRKMFREGNMQLLIEFLFEGVLNPIFHLLFVMIPGIG